MKIGCPKIVHHTDDKDSYSIKVNDTYLTNISEFNLKLDCCSNSELNLSIINPDVDLLLGYYHITSSESKSCKAKLYYVTDIRTGNKVECQGIEFDGKNLYIRIDSMQIKKDINDKLTR